MISQVQSKVGRETDVPSRKEQGRHYFERVVRSEWMAIMKKKSAALQHSLPGILILFVLPRPGGGQQTEAPPSSSTTSAPATSPAPSANGPVDETPSPTFAPRECWDNFTQVYFDLKEKAPFSSNTYVICPNQVYYIGYQYGVGNCCVDGDYPLVSRANTHFKCGEDGSRANNCTLVAGSTHVVYNEFVFDEELGGVVVEGFTFDSPQLMTSTLVGSGDIKFVDCVAKNQKNAGPFLASYDPELRRRLTQEDKDIMGHTPSERLGYVLSEAYLKSISRRSQSQRSKGVVREPREMQAVLQVVTFERCIFMNCSQGDYGNLLPTYGIISSQTPYNAFILSDCIFSGNEYDGTTPFGDIGDAIMMQDTDIIMTNSCLIDNNFYGFGALNLFGGSSYQARNNYLGGSDEGLKCSFIALSAENIPSNPANVTCVDADGTSCQASTYQEWLAMRPASVPTAAPSAGGRPTQTRPTFVPAPSPPQPTSGALADHASHISLLPICWSLALLLFLWL